MSILSSGAMVKPFDVQEIRKDFPILSRSVNGQPLVYLDNAASSQKPEQVLKSMDYYYRHSHANVHRGVHYLSQEATNEFELVGLSAQDAARGICSGTRQNVAIKPRCLLRVQ